MPSRKTLVWPDHGFELPNLGADTWGPSWSIGLLSFLFTKRKNSSGQILLLKALVQRATGQPLIKRSGSVPTLSAHVSKCPWARHFTLYFSWWLQAGAMLDSRVIMWLWLLGALGFNPLTPDLLLRCLNYCSSSIIYAIHVIAYWEKRFCADILHFTVVKYLRHQSKSTDSDVEKNGCCISRWNCIVWVNNHSFMMVWLIDLVDWFILSMDCKNKTNKYFKLMHWLENRK